MDLACVVGTRPQIIKAAAIWPALRRRHRPGLIDTGQHYDEELAGHFFGELHLPPPAYQLAVMSGTHARQVAAMIDRLEPVLVDERPRAVVVFGDTNSTLAGALVAAKLSLPLAHVEAGLRSFDRRMPEEVNRVVVDHLSQLLFAPNEEAGGNLGAEGIGAGAANSGVEGAAVGVGRGGPGAARSAARAAGDVRVEVVGDLMQDLCAATLPAIRDPEAIASRAPEAVAALRLRPGGYVFATVHRAENRLGPAIGEWLRVLGCLDREVVLALHPGTHRALDEHDEVLPANVRLIPPQGYRTTLALQLHAGAVATDSGGVQREAAWLGVPTLILRETTEWSGTLESRGGRSALVGRDPDRAAAALARLAPAASAVAEARARAATAEVEPAGAAESISASLAAWLER